MGYKYVFLFLMKLARPFNALSTRVEAETRVSSAVDFTYKIKVSLI